MATRPPLTGAQRAKRDRTRKGAGLIHLGVDVNVEVLASWLIREGILTEAEAEQRENLVRGLETLIARQGLRNAVTLDAPRRDETGVQGSLRTTEIFNV